MKKALTLILMVGAVIVMSSVVMAQSLAEQPISVSANVAPYAEITPAGGPLNLGAFTGDAYQQKIDGTGLFTVETNTLLSLLFDFDLTHVTEGTPLITYFKIYKNTAGWLTQPDDTFVLPPASFSNAQAEKTTEIYAVAIMAKTGAISDQAAGNYTGTVTLTAVSSP